MRPEALGHNFWCHGTGITVQRGGEPSDNSSHANDTGAPWLGFETVPGLR